MQTTTPRSAITLYQHEGYSGRELTLTGSVTDLTDQNFNFNDITSSIIVHRGTWKLFEHTNYEGRYINVCVGKYNIDVITRSIGNDTISSVKKINVCIISLTLN